MFARILMGNICDWYGPRYGEALCSRRVCTDVLIKQSGAFSQSRLTSQHRIQSLSEVLIGLRQSSIRLPAFKQRSLTRIWQPL